MSVEHAIIQDPQIHEPKGVAIATAGQIYVSNGVASGAWEDFTNSDTVIMTDVSNPSFILIPIARDCTVQSITFVLYNAITVANSVLAITRGGDAASLGSQTIAFTASAEGTTFVFTPSGNNVLSALTHKYIKIASDGASSTTAQMACKLKVLVT